MTIPRLYGASQDTTSVTAEFAALNVLFLDNLLATKQAIISSTFHTYADYLARSYKFFVTSFAGSFKRIVYFQVIMPMGAMARKQEKITNFIIKLIAVKMMNGLTLIKSSTNMLFHSITMFANHPTFNGNYFVTMRRTSTLVTRVLFLISPAHVVFSQDHRASFSGAFFRAILKSTKSILRKINQGITDLAGAIIAVTHRHTRYYTLKGFQ